jgi:hypothetical protein
MVNVGRAGEWLASEEKLFVTDFSATTYSSLMVFGIQHQRVFPYHGNQFQV